MWDEGKGGGAYSMSVNIVQNTCPAVNHSVHVGWSGSHFSLKGKEYFFVCVSDNAAYVDF